MKLIPDKKDATAAASIGQTATPNGSTRGPRSPNFPSIPLADAIGKARTLYEQDKRNAVSLNTVLTHLGFGAKLSGTTARVLSALKQFGLLEQVGTGAAPQFKVTDLAYHIVALSEGSPDRLKAVQDAVKKPAIYRELLGHFADGLPSDPALSDYLLLQKKFNKGSIETFIRVFKASIEVAKLAPGSHNGLGGEIQPGGDPTVPEPIASMSSTFTPGDAVKGPTLIPPQSWVLSVPRGIRAELRIIGQDVRKEDLGRLKRQIDFLVESFEEDQ